MSCAHSRTATARAFCGECGLPLAHRQCRCGAIGAAEDLYCSSCGMPFSTRELEMPNPGELRFNLEEVLAAARHDEAMSDAHKARVNQDDIKKLLARRKRGPK